MQQIKHWRRPSQARPHDPVLTSEDEAFLRNIVSEPTSEAPNSSAGAVGDNRSPVSPIATDAPETLWSPVSPLEEFRELGEEARKAREKEEQGNGPDPQRQSSKDGSSSQAEEKKKKTWSSWLRRKTTVKKTEVSGDAQINPPVNSKDENDARQETEDMTEILERLNLAADNNRVFSVSEEMQELLRKFKLIFKDLINGVPTAYHDLEMLLTNGNTQLQGAYSKLPGPIQKLIEKLPERWTETLAPEMIAVASERAAKSGVNIDNIGKAAAAANKMGIKVPSLKELVGKPAAIVGMLRSIIAFLRARFPAVLGMNVLWSLALSILLFVLWYCHKRGREVRLENERLVTEEEIEKLNEQSSSDERIRTTETLTTTAPQGASAAEIREGVKDAQQSRERAIAAAESAQPEKNEAKDNMSKPTRSKSILAIWGRSGQKPEPATKIQPYPGT
ncbi:hypothetical protein BDV32DRAFT_139078 [Aspergillus pseudonomiae]|uniref:Uncharacterized protein n=1 Tax=Aspergillus pseudonomiae TaxID=1506151 RepID=A0A5N7DE96_9EURO|nr:uncharacterized protein BDV37DRAFT_271179 [Aspergillus pseudonomiae]KAB8259169.1 hypothetical protein BDV32DRAFT_139078 [Aspergillus pseudonomiae]KAE8404722.1 hypothetical protein BDV37DRAFT_271179 [Aspergillus pseudonomiae]